MIGIVWRAGREAALDDEQPAVGAPAVRCLFEADHACPILDRVRAAVASLLDVSSLAGRKNPSRSREVGVSL